MMDTVDDEFVVQAINGLIEELFPRPSQQNNEENARFFHWFDSFEKPPTVEEPVYMARLDEDKELLIAAELGDIALLGRILKTKKVNVQEKDLVGRNALHLAVCSGNLQLIQMLLMAKVNPNVKDNVGMTPLSLCLMRRPSYEVADLLFQYGAQIKERTSETDTGLFLQFVMMCTPTEEEKKLIWLLLNKGALLEDPGAPGGRQALHFAAMSNNVELLQVLVDLGADLNVKNHRNQTPKELAAAFKCKEAQMFLEDIEYCKLFSQSSQMLGSELTIKKSKERRSAQRTSSQEVNT